MAKIIRRSGVRRVLLSEINDDLLRFLREAEGVEIVITRDEQTGWSADRLRIRE